MIKLMPIPKTAEINDLSTINLCKQLVPNGTPQYLEIETVEGSIENDCYENVKRIIEKNGGEIQYGWQIWETLPSVMIEAEFHAVWIDKNGVYHEVTPKSLPSLKRILFLPDPKRRYSGCQIDNVRIALKDDVLVHKFIENAELLFKETNRGDLANFHGKIIPSRKMLILLEKKQEIFFKILRKYYQ
ncbi:hypothetical protein L0P88_13660 [Muricauda sp. SCSIO 64092]|uniref:hypothetical protein n=1 Tax=Allomuricauda sp. SCSIO 64092 TaxID=2908842 RepID=UPI001FF20F1B|nr:hypothetical protein [Muricauda sp. SCSIO 64092]UOY04998.1 hypothetical protein L0P88_13660 [Muricauda sp. SCSIO 64092]